MPFEAVIAVTAVIAAFGLFAVTLGWAIWYTKRP